MRVFVWTIAAALLLFGAPVDGECPNGCSGNGDCMAKDMCNCYKNYQGNDCADRTCLFGYAHVDTPKGDINMDQLRATPGWILTNSQQHPEGTYEYRNPDAVANEAHFYMECSNKGICDRATGICNCFDGYDGNGCQRTSCPNRCSGHGTCESLRELGSKAGGTLFGKGLAAGSVKYDLWDANSTYGCHCDPWFQGPDCNKRTCKVGVDPLYLSAGTPRYETFVVHAYTTTGSMTTGSLRLRVFDYYGESYLTEPITILDDATAGNGDKNAAAVAAAIKAIPNQTFRDIKCEDEQSTAVGASLATYKSLRTGVAGLSVICQFVDNPGVMRIPEVASYLFDGVVAASQNAFVATTALQGENDDWFTTKATSLAVTTTADSGATYSVSADPTSLALTNKFIKLGPHIVHVASFTTTALTFTYPVPYTLSTADKTIFTLDSAVAMTISATGALDADFNVGDKIANFGANTPGVAEGDLVFFENQFFNVRRVWLDTDNYVEFDKPFGGKAADGDKAVATDTMLKVVLPTDKTKAYNYVSECSGRGLCGTETGICTCFKGYTNDNCNTQNILAL